MAALKPQIPGGSTNGRMVKVVATATAGTILHTAATGTSDMDEVYIWAVNSHSADVLLTIEFGGVGDPDDLITYTVPFDDGLHLIVPGIRLQNGLVVRAFAGTANVILCAVNVNRLIAVA